MTLPEQLTTQGDITDNHRLGRPYVMMHQGRQIFSEWFNVLIDEYHDTYGTEGLSATDELGVIAVGAVTKDRLIEINERIQPQTLDQHASLLALYTSMGVWLGRSKRMLTMSLEDSIVFFAQAPIAIALDTWRRTPSLKNLPAGKTVKQMLVNQSYIDCMEDLAKTGFGVLTTDFGYLDLENDTNYQTRRARLGAQPDDPELVTVEETEAGFHFSLAQWATQALHDRLIEQNKSWPNHPEASHSGALEILEAPISSGCPVRKLTIAPLCRFLSEQIKPAA